MKKVLMVLAEALIALPMLAAPKPTPTPAAGRIKALRAPRESATKANSLAGVHREGTLITPSPTARPVGIVEYKDGEDGVNRSKKGQPPPPICARLVNGKIEHYPCPPTPEGTSERDKLKGTTKTQGDFNLANREVQPTTPAPMVTPVRDVGRKKVLDGKTDRMPTVTGRVVSQQGRTFTVLVNGKAITFSGAKLKALPKVGATVDVDFIRTPDGQLEATRTIDLFLKGTSR